MAAAPTHWRTWDLGDFRLQTPPGWTQVVGGIDSQAGTLAEGGLRIEYDFGRYSDPLARREDMQDYRSNAGMVDGLPARFVQFRSVGPAGQRQTCSGVHVPRIRPSGTSMLSLTVLACADTEAQLGPSAAILGSIRWHVPVSR